MTALGLSCICIFNKKAMRTIMNQFCPLGIIRILIFMKLPIYMQIKIIFNFDIALITQYSFDVFGP